MSEDQNEVLSNVHYDHAPIMEAVIELQCQLPASVTLANLLKFHADVSADYPEKQEQHEVEVSIGGPTNSIKQIGYKFTSKDQKQNVIASLRSFAFGRLAPYDRWDSMRAEASRLWQLYKSTMRPDRITRVGVRYINRIDVPTKSGGIDLDEYFQTAPRIASSLPQGLESFFMRLQIPIEGAMLLITETTAAPPRPDLVSTLLDIDVFAQRNNINDGNVWQIIERLRVEKNRVFEACITDRVRDLIK
jgi:uncharacterized protein (TIGR04255 family)